MPTTTITGTKGEQTIFRIDGVEVSEETFAKSIAPLISSCEEMGDHEKEMVEMAKRYGYKGYLIHQALAVLRDPRRSESGRIAHAISLLERREG